MSREHFNLTGISMPAHSKPRRQCMAVGRLSSARLHEPDAGVVYGRGLAVHHAARRPHDPPAKHLPRRTSWSKMQGSLVADHKAEDPQRVWQAPDPITCTTRMPCMFDSAAAMLSVHGSHAQGDARCVTSDGLSGRALPVRVMATVRVTIRVCIEIGVRAHLPDALVAHADAEHRQLRAQLRDHLQRDARVIRRPCDASANVNASV